MKTLEQLQQELDELNNRISSHLATFNPASRNDVQHLKSLARDKEILCRRIVEETTAMKP